MERLYESVCDILRGNTIGCLNVGNKKVFDEISARIVGFGCFRRVIYKALIEQVANTIRLARERNWLNKDYVCPDVSCDDEDLMYACQLSVILFPAVLCYYHRTKYLAISDMEEVYAFKKMNDIDIENICDMFTESVRDNIRMQLNSVESTEEATEIIIGGTFMLPF